eukprot:1154239-Pelagomonas_calceolata.AAC.9
MGAGTVRVMFTCADVTKAFCEPQNFLPFLQAHSWTRMPNGMKIEVHKISCVAATEHALMLACRLRNHDPDVPASCLDTTRGCKALWRRSTWLVSHFSSSSSSSSSSRSALRTPIKEHLKTTIHIIVSTCVLICHNLILLPPLNICTVAAYCRRSIAHAHALKASPFPKALLILYNFKQHFTAMQHSFMTKTA